MQDTATNQHEARAPDPERLVDIEGASELLGLATSTLYNLKSKRIGPPCFKVGRRVFYRVADLLAWRDRFRVATVADLQSAGSTSQTAANEPADAKPKRSRKRGAPQGPKPEGGA